MFKDTRLAIYRVHPGPDLQQELVLQVGGANYNRRSVIFLSYGITL